MRSSNGSSRREFVRTTALATGAAGLALGATGTAAGQEAADRAPDAVLARLLEGNKRFVDGKLIHPGRTPADFTPLAEGQAPVAIIVGCADSRVSPEVVFDQGVGELFVVRIAGNVIAGAGAPVKGSIEFAVAELGGATHRGAGTRRCGAVKAGIAHIDANDVLPGAIRDLVDLMRPAAQAVARPARRQARKRDQGQRQAGRRAAQRTGSNPVEARQDGRIEGRRRRLRICAPAWSR